MENINPISPSSHGSAKKIIWIIIILAVIGLLSWWIFGSNSAVAPDSSNLAKEEVSDQTAAANLQAEVQGLNEVDLQNELQGLDADINNL